MATSGSVDFAMTAREIVTEAFQTAKVISGGETPTGDEMADGMRKLNLMLKTWSAKEHLWIRAEGTQVLTATTQSYAITGARRMLSVRRRTSSIDTPLNELAREEYFDLPTKSATGTPVSWYFDPQRTTRTLYLWPTASVAVAANTTLLFTYLRVIEDIDSLENDPDVPQEWLEALIYSLAARLALAYGSDQLQNLTAIANGLVKDLSAQDQEPVSVYFQPGQR